MSKPGCGFTQGGFGPAAQQRLAGRSQRPVLSLKAPQRAVAVAVHPDVR